MGPYRASQPSWWPSVQGPWQTGTTDLSQHFYNTSTNRFSRKPLILASLAGYVLLNIIYMANAYWFYELKVDARVDISVGCNSLARVERSAADKISAKV